jgi:hypothetical protein
MCEGCRSEAWLKRLTVLSFVIAARFNGVILWLWRLVSRALVAFSSANALKFVFVWWRWRLSSRSSGLPRVACVRP